METRWKLQGARRPDARRVRTGAAHDDAGPEHVDSEIRAGGSKDCSWQRDDLPFATMFLECVRHYCGQRGGRPVHSCTGPALLLSILDLSGGDERPGCAYRVEQRLGFDLCQTTVSPQRLDLERVCAECTLRRAVMTSLQQPACRPKRRAQRDTGSVGQTALATRSFTLPITRVSRCF